MVYYRLEYPDGVGPFAKPLGYIDEDGLRYLRHRLYTPKLHWQHPTGIPHAKSWFTEHGYQKYKPWIDLALKYGDWRGLRLITSEQPGSLLMKGKVQVIALNEE